MSEEADMFDPATSVPADAPAGEVSPQPSEASCLRCGRPTYDPDKRERPWARGVLGGRQALICPACQDADPTWASGLERCDRCGDTRLSAMLGEVVCRSCGTIQAP